MINKISNLFINCLKCFILFSLFALIPGCEEGLSLSVPAIDGGFSVDAAEGTIFSRTITLQIAIDNADEMCFSNDSVKWSVWEPYASSKIWILEDGDGDKTVFARFRRRHSLRVVERNTSIALVNMDGSNFVINSGSDFCFSGPLSLSINVSGAVKMRFSNNNTTWSHWEPFAKSKRWIPEDGFGEKTVFVEFRDNAGNSSDASDSITVIGPGDCSLLINKGSAECFVRNVALKISVPHAFEMHFSNDEKSWSAWSAFGSDAKWELNTGTGEKTVFAEFRDSVGNILLLSDSILLSDDSSSSFVINNNAPDTFSKTVTFNSNVEGAVEMRFGYDGEFWKDWEPYKTSRDYAINTGFGSKTVHMQFRDAVGNEIEKSDSITLFDSSGFSLRVNNGASHTLGRNSLLNINGPGASQVCFSNDGSSWSEWEDYKTSWNWEMIDGNGSKTVFMKFKDSSG
ncbi:MAG: hypothetical protein GY754_07210, partial [bacterium]|nr:hypothetical protein [bacterium]